MEGTKERRNGRKEWKEKRKEGWNIDLDEKREPATVDVHLIIIVIIMIIIMMMMIIIIM